MELANIKNSLQVMKQSPIHGKAFIEAKVAIQNELFTLLSNPPAGFEEPIKTIERNWCQLGGPNGTLYGYVAAIAELKNLVEQIEATQLKIF